MHLRGAIVYAEGPDLLKQAGDEAVAVRKVKKKYAEEFLSRDLHFFLGTTQEFHFRAPNPWVIVGVFPIPHETQKSLLG